MERFRGNYGIKLAPSKRSLPPQNYRTRRLRCNTSYHPDRSPWKFIHLAEKPFRQGSWLQYSNLLDFLTADLEKVNRYRKRWRLPSSVGRAEDWKSLCRWFDSGGSHHLFQLASVASTGAFFVCVWFRLSLSFSICVLIIAKTCPYHCQEKNPKRDLRHQISKKKVHKWWLTSLILGRIFG